MSTPTPHSPTPQADLLAAATPSIGLVLPSSGPASGGNPVLILGSGLANASSVTFGGTPASILFQDPIGLLIIVTAPAHAPGTVPVVVTTTSGTSAPAMYTYIGPPPPPPAPTATSILPATGPTTGGTPFVISGTNLTGATVTFGGAAATVVASTPTQISGLTPPNAAGNVPVVVTTPGGMATVPGGFTYLALPPTVTATVSPNVGVAAGGTPFTIVGTNLTNATVTFGGNAATITTNTGTVITGTTPPGTATTTVNVVVTTPAGTASAGAFTYV
ncbi:IPT/TIG domain-containing protein [Streptomyces silvisoli]|uniref:IPT/TIG domain-containing protein n=1 Tax=Streptomyces silvisoli TaxID=3034235 RepID=A0ABT5ZZB9_9ACTN|nr:IPT/TIG domain-containing protein [Streptomyces silvisoli]MDF3294353.1 IPT/TIG domain-containing protein [Streptomyces silvisoli]